LSSSGRKSRKDKNLVVVRR